jgi:hypothetical protein
MSFYREKKKCFDRNKKDASIIFFITGFFLKMFISTIFSIFRLSGFYTSLFGKIVYGLYLDKIPISFSKNNENITVFFQQNNICCHPRKGPSYRALFFMNSHRKNIGISALYRLKNI